MPKQIALKGIEFMPPIPTGSCTDTAQHYAECVCNTCK